MARRLEDLAVPTSSVSDPVELSPEGSSGLSPQEPGRAVEIVVVVGHDELGLEVCRRLARAGKQLNAVWPIGLHDIEDIDPRRVAHVVGDARRPAVLSRAGARIARTILIVTPDDQLNLRVALAARELNPAIRVVLRQFNRIFGRKIALNLSNAVAVSPETYAAATFAASCLNGTVYQALEFPRYSEQLVAFCRVRAAAVGAVDHTVADLEQHQKWRVLAIDDERFPGPRAIASADCELTFACRLEQAPRVLPRRERPEPPRTGPARGATPAVVRLDPVFVGLAALLAIMLAVSTLIVSSILRLPWFDAFYYVVSTITTTGSNELQNLPDSIKLVSIVLMVGGVVILGTLVAFLTAAVTKRSIEFAQGRHALSLAGHILVCGFGHVGTRVTLYLLHQGRRVVVIDRNPDASLAGEVRARGAHVMTADATSESALQLACAASAAGLLAVTDSDSANLEIALTARAFADDMPIILRIAEPAMARAVESHFRIRASYSSAALAAPLVTGLALEHSSRGSVAFAGGTFPLVQRARGTPLAAGEIVLAQQDDVELVLGKAPA